MLEHQPLPKGNTVGIIANSAGMATIFADACEMNNLILQENSLINLGAFTTPDKYEDSIKKLLLDENINSLFKNCIRLFKDILQTYLLTN